MNFVINSLERQFKVDINGDGYIGGQGVNSWFERALRYDIDGDGMIGRPYDVQPTFNRGHVAGYGGYGFNNFGR